MCHRHLDVAIMLLSTFNVFSTPFCHRARCKHILLIGILLFGILTICSLSIPLRSAKMPPLRTTTVALNSLRSLMKNRQHVPELLHAYIVLNTDAHQNEYLAARDKRLQYLTNFSGSSAVAIVTEHHACLWTDGRYFLQASRELDDNWTLMKEGVLGTPTRGEWLARTLQFGSRVGVDDRLMSYTEWRRLETEIEQYGLVLVPVETNLIDLIWTDRPPPPRSVIMPLPLTYTGARVSEKINQIWKKMNEKKATALLITALDEIAWVLNLRGSDIPYNPVFFSYLLIDQTEVHFFIDEERYTESLKNHFYSEGAVVIVHRYEDVQTHLKELSSGETAADQMIWISHSSSCAFTKSVKQRQLISSASPIAAMKAVKNREETEGLINAHIKDAAAMCCYFAWLESEVPKGTVTEIEGAKRLEEFRRKQEGFMGSSFETISASGPNGAVIHYKPELSTNRQITTTELYLCDSGGQYVDGTTDVTRTMHFGTPTDFQKEAFTRVFKGMINIATAVFPRGVKGNVLDTLARKYLWDVGLDYSHGTGHGIGAYLNVHEGPMGISWRPYPDDPGLQEGMFLSDEPGYYKDNEFGIRIENIVRIVEADTKYTMNNTRFLTFDAVTLVPIQRKMLDPSLLTKDEIEFLDRYHTRCRETVGELLKSFGEREALEWLERETQPLS